MPLLLKRWMYVQRSPSIIFPLLFLSSFCHGQSLADLARQNRQKKQQQNATTAKVFTTDDLSPSPGTRPAPEPLQTASTKNQTTPEPVKTLGYENYTPEMWQRSITAQKHWVTFLQKEAEKLKTSPPPQFAKKSASDPDAREYWEERGIQQQYAAQIPEQQHKLKEMQDEAQKAGMPPSTYDPK